MADAQQDPAPVRAVGIGDAGGRDGGGAVRAERLDGRNGPARAAPRRAARAGPGPLAAGGQVRPAPGDHARRGDMRALGGGQHGAVVDSRVRRVQRVRGARGRRAGSGTQAAHRSRLPGRGEPACGIAGGGQAAPRDRGAGKVHQLLVFRPAREPRRRALRRAHRPAGSAAASCHPRPQPLVGTPADSRVAVADLRALITRVAPRLERWRREGNWGILLVPVTSFGLTIFGVRPWTIAAIVAAIVISIRWPRLAADLVPLLLLVVAPYGFILVARWVPGPRVLATPQPTRFGAIPVDSSQTSLLAGVEASALLAFGAWLFPRTIGAHSRGKPTTGHEVELAGRVQRLTETRGHALDAAAAQLRRIERDLHDGAQTRLVALGMNLRALERMLPASPEAARALATEAIETSARALSDLRLLVRGIYPPVLADRGLGHAVRALALDTALPVELDIDLPGRLTAPVESACYFAVAEAFANAVKHSAARRIHLRIEHADDLLRIELSDDGVGAADPANGTGLSGVERRLGTFDGILAVSSPPGGPTMIAMEVPCRLLSPKISSCSGTG